ARGARLLHAAQHAADQRDADGAACARSSGRVLCHLLFHGPVRWGERRGARLRLCRRATAVYRFGIDPPLARRGVLFCAAVQNLTRRIFAAPIYAIPKTMNADLASL